MHELTPLSFAESCKCQVLNPWMSLGYASLMCGWVVVCSHLAAAVAATTSWPEFTSWQLTDAPSQSYFPRRKCTNPLVCMAVLETVNSDTWPKIAPWIVGGLDMVRPPSVGAMKYAKATASGLLKVSESLRWDWDHLRSCCLPGSSRSSQVR